jgi:hypothetical protein
MAHVLDTITRQNKFLATYKATKDAAEAANEAWPELPPKRRVAAAKRAMTQPDVARALDRYGLGLSKIMTKHQKLLDAKKTIVTNGLVEEVDNSEVQAKMVELGYRMHGLLKATNTPEPTQVQVTIDPGRLKEVADRLEAINTKMLRDNVVEANIV